MFDSFKEVKVYCKNVEELSNLLQWLEPHLGISHAARQTISVDVIKAKWDSESNLIRGFYVSVPLEAVKPRMRKLSVQEAFEDILNP